MQKVRPPRPDRLHPTTSTHGGANNPNPETAESQPPFTCEPTCGLNRLLGSSGTLAPSTWAASFSPGVSSGGAGWFHGKAA